MSYQELSKLFYSRSESDRFSWLDHETETRRNALSTIDVGLASDAGKMFVAMPPELIALVEDVYAAELAISLKFGMIGVSARRALVRGLVLDEVVSTNAIENVRSTRKQVEDALGAVPASSGRGRRFRELACLYLALDGERRQCPETPADIRAVYDQVMDGEDLGGNVPDGKLFRAGGVEVVGDGGRVLHEGPKSESEVTEAIEAMLSLLSRRNAPATVLAMASHYLFEYAHPFYDGNGRTGRYLLSLYLSDILSIPSVLSLSRAILENRESYYRAFHSAGDPLNKGELTFFVMRMLELLRSAQDGVSLHMDRAVYFADVAADRLMVITERDGIPQREHEILNAMVQIELFGMFFSVGMTEIADAVGIGVQMTRKHVARLEKRGLVVKKSARPLRVALSDEAREDLGIAK